MAGRLNRVEFAGPSTVRILHTRFPPEWRYLDPLRHYVESYFTIRRHAEAGQRAGLILHELGENAVKYSQAAHEVEVAVGIDGRRDGFEIRVVNRAVSSRILVLERELERSQSGQAAEAFSRAMERLRSLPVGATMLGLARLRAEAGAVLSLEVEGSQVTVIAFARW